MVGTFDEQWDADDLRIDINTPYVLAYWAHQLGVTTDELRTAIGRVGPVLRDVKKNLDNDKSARGLSREQDDVERRRPIMMQPAIAT